MKHLLPLDHGAPAAPFPPLISSAWQASVSQPSPSQPAHCQRVGTEDALLLFLQVRHIL